MVTRDVYKVNGRHAPHRQRLRLARGASHVHGRRGRRTPRRTRLQALERKICSKLGKANGANPNSDSPPKFPYLENGVGQCDGADVDKPGYSGDGTRQEGRGRST